MVLTLLSFALDGKYLVYELIDTIFKAQKIAIEMENT